MPHEIDIKESTIELLLDYVKQHVDINANQNPFYMNVDADLRERAFGDYLNTDIMETAYIYAHTQAIPLHVDRYKKNGIYNLCVPLYKNTQVEQRLMVFDQTFDSHGMSWRLEEVVHEKHEPAGPSHQNTSDSDNDHLPSEVLVGIRPCDTEHVSNLTDKPLPNEIADLLPHGNKDFYHGLTGIAWNWNPGKALVFKSSQIHGTAHQSEFKIGCVVLMNSDQV